MSIDLIDRVLYLNAKGKSEPIDRFYKWLEESCKAPSSDFDVEGIEYYWKIISSHKFKDIIDEDITDWLLIYSTENKFKALAKFQSSGENLIGESTHCGIATLWLLEADTINEVRNKPVLIFTPHYFSASQNSIEYDLKQLIKKINNPKVKLYEFVTDKKSEYWKRRIR